LALQLKGEEGEIKDATKILDFFFGMTSLQLG
jgi:hypothetical protein